jgi:molybdopterin molybdotransferase
LGVEAVGLAAAAGRVLATPVRAAVSLPGFDTAAMDGYAVAGAPPWRVAGRVVTGSAYPGRLAPRTAVEITTGAMVPAGADAVVPYETCRRDGILVYAPVGGRDHIRRAGEDLAAGEVLAGEGTVVSVALLGLIAHAGVDLVEVHRQPRVLVVVTGDEVTAAGVPGAGQVRDALGPLLAALVGKRGAVVTGHLYLPDGADVLRTVLMSAPEDVVVVTGSASVGLTDHLRAVLAGLGARLLVDGVACRPGHPQLLAGLPSGGRVVGLPGNPYAALVACLTLLQPLLEALGGRPPRPLWELPVTGKVTPRTDGVRLVPVRVQPGGARVVDGARPASLRAAAAADALACIEPGWVSGAPAQLLALP